jgi:catechol 2,3-dioxygenase-like lactoylglutathione lyase family enzyme
VSDRPRLSGVYIFSREMSETVAFYRRLGLEVVEVSEKFARAETHGGPTIEFGTAALTRSYDAGWQERSGVGTNTLRFTLPSRGAVDDKYRELTNAGYHGHLAPIDSLWGERFALIDDPDGNVIAIHSPPDRER